ncbi:uncharacterized protein LOC112520027 [Cynara cardunculus var. scolymus]|uniref:uncharacterized protein LOC112520027 n=1 Tax=Cynara cardunculus var. scolymus TaxID=59895 RepID=UPI000D62B7A5|nr:uncharacterized protein LOC112520027 [Cynara cardunculus var. scolymus]
MDEDVYVAAEIMNIPEDDYSAAEEIHPIRSFLGHLRPLLIMDGAHLKGPYVGTMFLAVSMNGNNQIILIAMEVGKTKSGPSWIWFLHKLRQCIGELPNLTFVTDRAASIELAIRTIFPNAHHRLCCRHLSQNLCLTSSRDKRKRWMFWETCKAYRVSDFETTMYLMWHSLPNAAQYLEEVGYARWARSHFPGLSYSAMTYNSVESVNSVTWFALQMINTTTPWAKAKIEKRIHRSENWRIYPISELLFEVDDSYVIYVARSLDIQDCSQFCLVLFNSDSYRTTYKEEVNLLPPEAEYVLPNERMTVLPSPMDIHNFDRPRNRDRISSRKRN